MMKIKVFFLCILTSLLLSLSFPTFNLEYLAWFGFVPLLFTIENETKRRAFWISYFSGFLFFILTIYWLVHVTLAGLILLCLYLALYFAFFGYFFAGFKKRFSKTNIFTIIFLSSIWVILEYIRSQFLSGFPWALLGYSQYLNTKIIQFIDLTGSFGLSFLVIFVNLCIFHILESISHKNFKSASKILLTLLIIFIIIYGYGMYSINKYSKKSSTTLRVSLLQGNIPQERKWQSLLSGEIKDIYFNLTRNAKEDNPDLIIWPETAYPDYIVDVDKKTLSPIIEIAGEVEIPILFGAVYQEKDKYFNSAILISNNLEVESIYKKIHLVPFGEYLPLRKYFSILERIVPIEDFSEGKEFTIFKIKNSKGQSLNFGVLICFEDTIEELSRKFRQKGADFLVNITNDAWFKQTSSPYQHLQASVFRAVENRVYVLRSANTGITAIIDNCGRVTKELSDNKGKEIFVKGFITGSVYKQDIISFYTRFGDIIILVCGLYIIVFAIYISKKM